VDYEIPLRNRGDTGVTLSGQVQLLGRHGEVLGTSVIPPTYVGPHDTEFVDGQVCPTHTGSGPYKVKVTVHSQDPQCDGQTRQVPVHENCCGHQSDVSQTQWYFGYVTYLMRGGVVSGFGDQTFRPNSAVTRAQMAKIVVNAFGFQLNTAEGSHFSDVPAGHSEYAYIETLYHRGLLSGYADGKFRPDANVTRGQAAKVLVQAAGWARSTRSNSTFGDVPANAVFHADVETAYAHGLLSGYADSTFRTGNSVTRAQLCKMIYGFAADTADAAGDE